MLQIQQSSDARYGQYLVNSDTGGLIVVKNLNSRIRRIKGRKLSRVLYLVGLNGEHLLDLGRIGRWSRSILRIGVGKIESLQRRLLGARRMSSWKAWVRIVE